MNFLLSIVFGATAMFHADLKASIPAAGAIVGQSPAQVTLVFTEKVTVAATSAMILKPDSSVVLKLALHPGMSADTVRGAVAPALLPGKYIVKWHAAAADDGHRTSGAFAFTVKGK